jgi:predicted dehydrogenase
MNGEPLRIGILGAARIAPLAVVKPAQRLPEATVVAVAARDLRRAQKFASKHGIPTVHESYRALLDDPTIEAVYNPLPNGLHGRWTLAAIGAGKHVLCEKPFAANADEAAEVAAIADASGLVVMEAFHYRYHPLADLMHTLVAEGAVGRVERIETRAVVPYWKPGDIRFDLSLAGGSLMDIGCYAVHQTRLVAASEPRVVGAEVKLKSAGVDRWIRAHLRWPDRSSGMITAGLYSAARPMIDVRVKGDLGMLKVFNPTGPQYYNRVTLKNHNGTKRERIQGESTYWYQLRAFVGAVRNGAVVLTPPSDAVKNMAVIDAIYRAAGMLPRQPTPA